MSVQVFVSGVGDPGKRTNEMSVASVFLDVGSPGNDADASEIFRNDLRKNATGNTEKHETYSEKGRRVPRRACNYLSRPTRVGP